MSDDKLISVAVSTVAPGPRFLYANGSKEVVRPGETRELHMTATEIKAASLHKLDDDGEIDTFTLDHDGDEPDEQLPGLGIAALRKAAEEESIELPADVKKRDDIAAFIVAAREAKGMNV